MDFFPPTIDTDLTCADVIERINNLASTFNFMGSIRCVNKCYIDGKTYSLDDLIEEPVYGCMAKYPYNTIQVSKMNSWVMKAMRLQFCKMNDLIPHTCHNLPTIFKIRRSNGTLYDAVAADPLYCIRISKKPHPSGYGEHIILYVRVHFSEAHPNSNTWININLITDHGSYKDVPLHDIYRENPSMPDFKISFSKMTKTDDMPEIADAVIENINTDFDSWCHNELQGSLNNYSNEHNINCSYTFI